MGRSWLYKVYAVVVGLLAGLVAGGAKYFIDAGGGWGYRDLAVSGTVGAVAAVLVTLMLLSIEKRD